MKWNTFNQDGVKFNYPEDLRVKEIRANYVQLSWGELEFVMIIIDKASQLSYSKKYDYEENNHISKLTRIYSGPLRNHNSGNEIFMKWDIKAGPIAGKCFFRHLIDIPINAYNLSYHMYKQSSSEKEFTEISNKIFNSIKIDNFNGYHATKSDAFSALLKDVKTNKSPITTYALGMAYLTGEIVPADTQMGIKYLIQSAKLEYAPAQLALVMFFSDEESIYWNEKAAKQWEKALIKNKSPEAKHIRLSHDIG